MFTFDGWVTRVTFELHWALETRLHASALNSELSTVSIPRSFRISSFLTYHGAFVIVLRIFACSVSILLMWLLAAVSHNAIPYVQIGFSIVLYILALFSRLSLDFRFITHCICLLVVCILFIIALICCFHVSCVSMWSRKYLTFPVCVMGVPFSSILADFCLRSVNVI